MNFFSKYFEPILVFAVVMFGSLILGVFARKLATNIGLDSFTANVTFWIFILLGIIIYVLIVFLIGSLYTAIIKLVSPKKKLTNLSNRKSDFSKNLKKIRTKQQVLNDQNSQNKKKIAIQYTQKEFAAYCTDEDLDLLCQYVIFYAEKKSLQKIKPITINDLSNLDFYHYGWNIWKHFKVGKQEEISHFLKIAFSNQLKEVEVNTIKSHLKDDELKGIIKIRKNLQEQ